MKRRTFNQALGGLVASSVLASRPLAAAEPQNPTDGDRVQADAAGGVQQIAMVVYPGFIPLDLFGPHAIFAILGNVNVHLVWKTRDSVIAATGLPIQPTTTFGECPPNLDVLFVPGGLEGTTAIMNDPEVLGFLQDRGQRARYVTSVCTGSLLLGAAGLLRGYRATSHWTVRQLLPFFGAVPVAARVVEDRNRITAGGVTAGIDFGLQVAARMRSEQDARRLQLLLEYDPQPPFRAGSPESAGTELTNQVRRMRAPAVGAARQAALVAQTRLANGR